MNWTEAEVGRTRFGANKGLSQQQQEDLTRRGARFSNMPLDDETFPEDDERSLAEAQMDAHERLLDFNDSLERLIESIERLESLRNALEQNGQIKLSQLHIQIQEATEEVDRSQRRKQYYKSFLNRMRTGSGDYSVMQFLEEIREDILQVSRYKRNFEEIWKESSYAGDYSIIISYVLSYDERFDIAVFEVEYNAIDEFSDDECLTLEEEDVEWISKTIEEQVSKEEEDINNEDIQ